MKFGTILRQETSYQWYFCDCFSSSHSQDNSPLGIKWILWYMIWAKWIRTSYHMERGLHSSQPVLWVKARNWLRGQFCFPRECSQQAGRSLSPWPVSPVSISYWPSAVQSWSEMGQKIQCQLLIRKLQHLISSSLVFTRTNFVEFVELIFYPLHSDGRPSFIIKMNSAH